MSVKVAIVGVPTESGPPVEGCLLIFDSLENRDEFFDVVRLYFGSSRTDGGTLRVQFKHVGERLVFSIDVEAVQRYAWIEIDPVSRDVLEALISIAERQLYYFVMGAYQDRFGGASLEPLAGNYWFKSDLSVNGEAKRCSAGGWWPQDVNPIKAVIRDLESESLPMPD